MLESLKQNPLFEESEKYVFIDGPRNEKDASLIKEVAQIAYTATDNVKLSPQNKGLGSSIIAGVSEVLNEHDAVIVLEDDLRLMPGFLTYMNNALEHFKVDERILAICGYSLKIKTPKGYDSTAYFGDRASSWGWGTWRDRWQNVDWEVSDWAEFSNVAATCSECCGIIWKVATVPGQSGSAIISLSMVCIPCIPSNHWSIMKDSERQRPIVAKNTTDSRLN